MAITQFVVNGLLVGALFTAVAVGFALIWGVVDIINLAHGEMVMLGGYSSYWMLSFLTGDAEGSITLFLLTIPLVIALIFVIGYALQRVLVSRVIGTDIFLTLLVTFGISIAIQQLAIQAWSANPRAIQILFTDTSLSAAGIVIPKMKLISFIGATGLTVVLYIFLQRTRTGRAIRAVSQNPEAAALVGIDVEHTRAMTFGISSAVAGGAGAFIATILNIQPQMGLIYTLKSFVIVVFGGVGSIPGVFIGGLMLGTVEELTAGLISSQWTLAVSFSLLIVLLIVKPNGLFGEEAGQ